MPSQAIKVPAVKWSCVLQYRACVFEHQQLMYRGSTHAEGDRGARGKRERERKLHS